MVNVCCWLLSLSLFASLLPPSLSLSPSPSLSLSLSFSYSFAACLRTSIHILCKSDLHVHVPYLRTHSWCVWPDLNKAIIGDQCHPYKASIRANVSAARRYLALRTPHLGTVHIRPWVSIDTFHGVKLQSEWIISTCTCTCMSITHVHVCLSYHMLSLCVLCLWIWWVRGRERGKKGVRERVREWVM